MRIKVKLNSTGETGTVEDKEFNPQIYTKINESTLPNVDLGEEPNQMASRLAEEQKAKESKVASVLPAIGSIAGGLVGGTLAGPVGAVIGAGLGGGGGEFGRQKETKEKTDFGKIAKETAWGAGGELLGLGAAKVIGKIGKGAKVAADVTKNSQVEDWGDDLIKSVIKPKVKVSPTMASDVDEIVKSAKNYGLTGMSAEKAATKMDDLYTTSMKEVEKAVKGFTPDTRVVKMSIDESLPKVSDLSKNTVKSIVKDLDSRLASSNGDDLLKLKYELQGDIKKIYNPAHNPTEEELVKAVYHDAIDQYLKLNVPGTEGGLKVMSDLHKIAPGIAAGMKNAEKGIRLPVVGNIGGSTTGKIIQAAKSKAGNIIQGTKINLLGNLPEIPKDITKLVAPTVLSGIELGRIGQLPQPTEQGLPEIQTQGTVPEVTKEKTNYLTGYSPEQIYQGYMKAKQAGDSKAASELRQMYTDETAYQKTQGKTGKAMTAGQKKELSDFEISEKLMNNLIPEIESAAKKGIIGPITGRARVINPYDTDVQTFNSSIKAVAQVVGRAMEGGVLRKEDIPKYEAMLPNVTDTKAVALGKIKNVAKMLELQRKTKENEYSSGENLSDYSLPSTTDTGLPDIGE